VYYDGVATLQTLVIRVPAGLARRARSYLDSGTGYEDLSELMCVALENQLELESSPETGTQRGKAAREDLLESPAPSLLLLRRPDGEPITAAPVASAEPLFSMTNRLFPLKIATRVLMNLESGATLHHFRAEAAGAARALGQQLRNEDARMGSRGADRRWIALPVADDEEAAMTRFAQHFTLSAAADGAASGPLCQLGLAALTEGEPRLSPLGAEFALAESPVLDEGAGPAGLLSEEERELLSRGIRGNSGEVAAIQEFTKIVREHGGRQEDVDAGLRHAHASWSEAQAVAHRAAMLGRLRDLGGAWVEGRGPSARIRLAENLENTWERTEKQ